MASIALIDPIDGLETTDPELVEIEHLLRRLAFGPAPGRARELLDAHGSPDAVRVSLRDAAPLPFDAPADLDGGLDDAPKALQEADRLVAWWVERMGSPDAGLHERMTWVWHTLVTTSVEKAPVPSCWRQLRTIHQHATGNFGTMLRALLDDEALFVYLDADGSRRESPNENLSRELLELFTLGRGAYGQADVTAGAAVLAGRYFDWGTGRIVVDTDQGRPRAHTYLGWEGVRDLDDLCAAILAHDACAPHVVSHVVASLVGTDVPQRDLDDWAQLLRSSDYELGPLLEAVTSSDAFRSARLARPRTGLEWFVAALAVTGHRDWSAWDLETVGQMPFLPPNVAGWPGSARWTSSTAALSRGTWITWFDPPAAAELVDEGAHRGSGDDLVDAVLDRCSLHEVSRRTRRALAALAADLLPFDPEEDPLPAVTAVLRAATLTPEFALA